MSRITQYFADKLHKLKEYPITLTKAVYDEQGNRLDNTLAGAVYMDDEEPYTGVEPRDADTLGGRITAEDVENVQQDLYDLDTFNVSENSTVIAGAILTGKKKAGICIIDGGVVNKVDVTSATALATSAEKPDHRVYFPMRLETSCLDGYIDVDGTIHANGTVPKASHVTFCCVFFAV